MMPLSFSMASSASVSVHRKKVVLPTYEPGAPDRNPMFLEKRVYQGSSGRVYPLPCTDRVAEKAVPRAWDAVYIENEFISVMILPELGGRIHRALDKTNHYDFIYYQPVIKPALVGLAGPWASGGIEFNWPQHHRPSTFMPADVAIEKHPDGSATVWLSEHDPMARMKGMHGVRVHPGKSYLEVVARAYNRTAEVQTFLWWANVATRVNEHYQSFFPPDATHVADHAKRATATYPLCNGSYYGVDYAARARNGVPLDELPRQFLPPRAKQKLTECRAGACAGLTGKSTVHLRGGASQATALQDGDANANDDRRRRTNLDYAPNDLSWYANIPVPTSYMCMGSKEDFAGGYDHQARAGIMQVANHHISPGKKQWTWGNHEFGYAWDRNLTVPDEHGEYAPYIELMSGVYTDNQPDFSYLQPGETKTWSQFWYPFREIGPAQHANRDAAISLQFGKGIARLGVAVTAVQNDAKIQLEFAGKIVGEWTQTITPGQPIAFETMIEHAESAPDFVLRVFTADGIKLIDYQPNAHRTAAVPPPASEPAAPAKIKSADELFTIGLHLEQYRHATRQPELYWREALRRDPGDSRCNLAMGRWHLRRGEWALAEKYLRASIERQTSRNPNPYDGEAYYQLGRCLCEQAFAAGNKPAQTPRPESPHNFVGHNQRLLSDAYDAFYKATWNQAWQSAGYHALAEIDALRGEWATALDHLSASLRLNTDNLRARNLQVIALRQLGKKSEAGKLLRETLALDPLDWWARFLRGDKLDCDHQVRLDLALDCARAGLFRDAQSILAEVRGNGGTKVTSDRHPHVDLPDASLGCEPLLHYYRAWIGHLSGDKTAERRSLLAAAKANPDYCFPARLEEIAILRHAIGANPRDARAPFLLGNLLYDRKRHREAIALWERAAKLEPRNAVAWRNLGIACFNILHRPEAARAAYERAFRAAPRDARLLYERDQLWKRLGDSPAKRLRELTRHPALVRLRDDLSVELCALSNQAGQPEKALAIVAARKFQPWEGGEGQALGQHVRTHLVLGRKALRQKDPRRALDYFKAALAAPENLGEAKHLLANQSDVHYWLGCAFAANGDDASARAHWGISASFKGDFQAMSVRAFSEMTYFSALALKKSGKESAARRLLRGLLAYARKLARTRATIDYFATSLPTMLLFDDDLQARQKTTALFLEAQARLGLGENRTARKLLRAVLRRDPNHALAADLLE
jgi:tetratricopeptide (TPR) repeat protein